MNEEMEELLGRLAPRRAAPGLRAQVLAAVEGEIAGTDAAQEPGGSGSLPATVCESKGGQAAHGTHASHWPRRLGLAVAASILLGLGLNVWAARSTEQRIARLFGPPPVSKQAAEIASTIASVTDEATGRWAYERLAATRPSPDAAAKYAAKYAAALQELIEGLQHPLKDTYHAKTQEDTPMDRDRGRGADRNTSDRQRGLRLDYRFTA